MHSEVRQAVVVLLCRGAGPGGGGGGTGTRGCGLGRGAWEAAGGGALCRACDETGPVLLGRAMHVLCPHRPVGAGWGGARRCEARVRGLVAGDHPKSKDEDAGHGKSRRRRKWTNRGIDEPATDLGNEKPSPNTRDDGG